MPILVSDLLCGYDVNLFLALFMVSIQINDLYISEFS